MKKLMRIMFQIPLLFIIFFIGTMIQQYFQLLIPGSVIGLVLLFILLTTGIVRVTWIEEGATFMNIHLVLFFIPATVGILHFYQLFLGKGILLVLITVISTILVMVISGLVSQWLEKRKELHRE